MLMMVSDGRTLTHKRAAALTLMLTMLPDGRTFLRKRATALQLMLMLLSDGCSRARGLPPMSGRLGHGSFIEGLE